MPVTTIAVQADSLNSQQLNALLDGYRRHVDNTPMPRVGLALTGRIKDSLEHLIATVRSGGIISIGKNKVRANNGIKKADVKTTVCNVVPFAFDKPAKACI